MKNILFSFAVILLFLSCKENKEQAAVKINEELRVEEVSSIPVFDFDGLEEAYFKNQDNNTYVINFWATWCKPCVKELPAFEKINEDYKDKNVKVILVSLDFPEKLKTGVEPFIEKYKLKSEVVLLDDADANTWIPKVSEEWSGAIPATVIVKNDEKFFYERSFTFEALEKEVNKLL